VHLSTDYVLAGHRAGKKNEAAKCKPVSVYGESKREAELAVLEALPTAVVLRVSWICGNPQKPAFVEQTVARALAGQPLAAIGDKESLPTDAEDIARVVLAMAGTKACGIWHVCAGGEPVSWHDCAVLALQCAVEEGALAVAPVVAAQKQAEVPFFREERPRYTAMSNEKLQAMGIPMPDAAETIRRVVKRYLAELKQQQVDTLVLGCTHYPLLKRLIGEEIGEEVILVNPSSSVVKEMKEYLQQNQMQSGAEQGEYEFYVSDSTEKFRQFGQQVLEIEDLKVKRINIEKY
jgi:hypothetical protein